MIDYRIKAEGKFNGSLGELVSMLEHVRSVTLQEISDLEEEELDYLPYEKANSIGALLWHIAAVEFVHQIVSFEDRDLTDDEYEKWRVPLELGDKARETIRNKPLSYYINELAQVRKKTLAVLTEKDKEWLLKEKTWDNGVAHNNYYLWFHVLEDEISHRGQIRMIKRQMEEEC